MKINWDRWVNRDRRSLLLAGYLLFASAIVVICIRYTQPSVKDKSDLMFITGNFKDFDFRSGSKWNRRNYTFTLNEYKNSFKIKADYLTLFFENDFKQIGANTELTISILNKDADELNIEGKYLLVYSIASKNSIFLDLNNTIERQNSNRDYYYFGGLLIFSIVFLYFGYKSKVKTKIF